MNDIDRRLERLRGAAEPVPHNARTLAALTSNPGCTRRRVLDAAGVDKRALAEHLGTPTLFGNSPFALIRGKAFEALVKANGAAELIRLLRERLGLPLPEVAYDDLNSVAGHESLTARHLRSRQLLLRAARSHEDPGTLFDHPMLRLQVQGRGVFLEPDLVAFKVAGQFRIVEIKSFPVIDRHADPDKVAAAALQLAVYALALRQLLAESDVNPDLVSDQAVLVCPKDFSNRPTAALVDVRKPLTVVRRQLQRLHELDATLVELPAELTLDLRRDAAGVATRSAAELADALDCLPPRYAPQCLSTCELAYVCRAGAAGTTAALGRSVQEGLAGIDTVAAVLGLASGQYQADPQQAESALLLRQAERLRRACWEGAA